MRQGEDISRNELHLLVGHEPHSSAPDKPGIRSAADDASQLTVELLQLRGREGFSPLANFAWCAFMTSWSRKTAWTNSARLAGRPNRSHLTGGSTWASKAAGANFPTDTGSAGRANGANVARETNSARFTGSTDCALGTSFAGVACTPSGTVAALRAGEASRTDNAAGALRTDGTTSAGLTDVTRETDGTLKTFGADYTGEADVTCRSSVACVAFEAAIPLRTRNAFGSNGPWRPSRPSWAGETSWAKCSARANGTHGARCTILAILAIVSADTSRSS